MTTPLPLEEVTYRPEVGPPVVWPPCTMCGRGVQHVSHIAGHAYRNGHLYSPMRDDYQELRDQ